MPQPCLFLSHSGADTDGARELKRRLPETPAAREAGLTVWFDKDDLKPGLDRQAQLEAAITRQATAFAVLVGSKGVVNWVEREVRLGLARAIGADAIPFIAAEASAPAATAALPASAQQHHGVIDPLSDPARFPGLVDAVLGRGGPEPARLTDEPFVGLRAMTERESDRFFGRDTEVAGLVEDLRRNRLIAIVADSGADKGDAQAQRWLATALEKVGDVAIRTGDNATALEICRERVDVVRAFAAGDPGSGQAQSDLAEALGAMAYAALLDRGGRQALSLSDEAIAAAPDLVWLRTNRAHALMMLGRVDEARELYERYRGATAQNSTRWEDGVLDDFAALRRAGIGYPLMDEIEKEFSATPVPATK